MVTTSQSKFIFLQQFLKICFALHSLLIRLCHLILTFAIQETIHFILYSMSFLNTNELIFSYLLLFAFSSVIQLFVSLAHYYTLWTSLSNSYWVWGVLGSFFYILHTNSLLLISTENNFSQFITCIFSHFVDLWWAGPWILLQSS